MGGFLENMRNFLYKLNDVYRRFMQGRYGTDMFSVFLLISAIVLSFLSRLPFLWFLYYISAALLLYSLYRTLSKNIEKRYRELTWFEQKKQMVMKKADAYSRMRKDKTHRYFKCSCGTYSRVPKGRGKIKITCKRCGKTMIRKS